jgi:DNA-binding PadR family transcriptional regulator
MAGWTEEAVAVMEFDHILLSILGDSARTGTEIGAALRARHNLNCAPSARIYTALPVLERRGWVLRSGGADHRGAAVDAADVAEDTERARRWSLSRAGRGQLERWLLGPGGRPATSRVLELLVVLACMPRMQPDSAHLLRREIDRLESRRLMSPLRRGPVPGAVSGSLSGPNSGALAGALATRARGRRELWLAVLREWLRSLPASGYQ